MKAPVYRVIKGRRLRVNGTEVALIDKQARKGIVRTGCQIGVPRTARRAVPDKRNRNGLLQFVGPTRPAVDIRL